MGVVHVFFFAHLRFCLSGYCLVSCFPAMCCAKGWSRGRFTLSDSTILIFLACRKHYGHPVKGFLIQPLRALYTQGILHLWLHNSIFLLQWKGMEPAKWRGTVCMQRTHDCGCSSNCSLWERRENPANPPHNPLQASEFLSHLPPHLVPPGYPAAGHYDAAERWGLLSFPSTYSLLQPHRLSRWHLQPTLEKTAFMMKSKRGVAAAGARKRGVRKGCAVMHIRKELGTDGGTGEEATVQLSVSARWCKPAGKLK